MLTLILSFFFVAMGAAIKYAKMHFLIAGYNTMSEKEKEQYDIEGIASVFRTGLFGIALLLILIPLLPIGISPEYTDFVAILVSVFIGTTYILIKVNSPKYKVGQKEK